MSQPAASTPSSPLLRGDLARPRATQQCSAQRCRRMPCDRACRCSSLVSAGRGRTGVQREEEPEDELIDISMDSPDGGADSRWYRCASVAAFNSTLEFDATTPISGKVQPGVIIEALQHADTLAGKRRIRSHKGWFSLVSTNGTRCEPARLGRARRSTVRCAGGRLPRSLTLTAACPTHAPLADSHRGVPHAGCLFRAADRKKGCSCGRLTSGQGRRECLARAAPAQPRAGQGGAGRQQSGRPTQLATSSDSRAYDSPGPTATTRQLRRARSGGNGIIEPLCHLSRAPTATTQGTE